jgi:dTDP-4-dehydrorhamnose reductase
VRILITGGGGQLGRDLREVLVEHEVASFDHAGLDITDRRAVFRTVERITPHWVINAAAFNDVDGAETAAEAAFAVNATGPGNLAEAAATRSSAAMMHISTDYVFDGRKKSPYSESDNPNPLSVYGRSKYEGELRVLGSGENTMVVRTAWLYGRYGKNFVTAIRAAAAKGSPLRVVADQVGSPTATLDLARAIGRLITSPIRGLLHAVNAGSCSRYDFARAIVGTGTEIIPITSAEAARPATRPRNATLVSERWLLTGIDPLRPWEDALKDFLRTIP